MSLFHWLYPPRCILCKSAEDHCCASCRRALFQSPRRQHCLLCPTPQPYGHLCSHHRSLSALDDIITPYSYRYAPLRTLIRSFKYHNRPQLASTIAELLLPYIPPSLHSTTSIIVPMPSPAKRVRQRSYHPTLLLAQALHILTGIPLSPLLHCARNPKKQAGLTNIQRQRNVAGLFHLSSTPLCLDTTSIILLDDILTTGSTMEEAGHTLRTLQPRHLLGLCIAQNK